MQRRFVGKTDGAETVFVGFQHRRPDGFRCRPGAFQPGAFQPGDFQPGDFRANDNLGAGAQPPARTPQSLPHPRLLPPHQQ